ncbi:MAG: HEAT repeat domain-containing protein [Planctomycetia bacterium]|nr:HEAT repeat domain-containing protein [Planctomycetia bacterium]
MEKAIASLRNIVQTDFSEEDKKEAKAQEIGEAWKTILSSGKAGIARLKAEVEQLDAKKQKDDFFKLGACALLWQSGKLKEARSIAKIWETTPLHKQYNYVFYTAFAAAETQDARAAPMLKACLKDNKGDIFVALHSMPVAWPQTHAFLWGAYGPKGLPVLAKVFETSRDPVEIESAMLLLTNAQYLKALPKIRKLASAGKGDVRFAAVRCLGTFGHPKDYGLLLRGLKSKEPKELWNYVFALYEYGDLRAVPHLIPLLKTDDDALRNEVIATFAHLQCPASFEALHEYSKTREKKEEKEYLEKGIKEILKTLSLSWDAYEKKPRKEKEKLFRGLRNKSAQQFKLQKGDRILTRDEFIKAVEEWKKSHRITGGEYAWVKSRHILSVAKPDDINLLLEVRAAVYLRLSDECLYEVYTLNELIKKVSRSRYRKNAGICEKVE